MLGGDYENDGVFVYIPGYTRGIPKKTPPGPRQGQSPSTDAALTPVTPVTPVTPETPVTIMAPMTPVIPVTPMTPVTPVMPVTPETPVTVVAEARWMPQSPRTAPR